MHGMYKQYYRLHIVVFVIGRKKRIISTLETTTCCVLLYLFQQKITEEYSGSMSTRVSLTNQAYRGNTLKSEICSLHVTVYTYACACMHVHVPK